MSKLTHIDAKGAASMVDVSAKPVTARVATAAGRITMKAETLRLIMEGKTAKGDVIATARLAGIMAAKKTHELVPLCHPLMLTGIEVELAADEKDAAVDVTATVRTEGKTGVEMEALTAVSVACLTIYDMCKAVDRTMQISGIRLLEKQGGRSGHFRAE